jgi:hypothetical protein
MKKDDVKVGQDYAIVRRWANAKATLGEAGLVRATVKEVKKLPTGWAALVTFIMPSSTWEHNAGEEIVRSVRTSNMAGPWEEHQKIRDARDEAARAKSESENNNHEELVTLREHLANGIGHRITPDVIKLHATDSESSSYLQLTLHMSDLRVLVKRMTRDSE